MFKNFLHTTIRNLLSNRLFSLINILGLAFGLACVILIALFVRHETSYDQHWVNADRTYKVMRTFKQSATAPALHLATNAPQVASLLKQDFPEFEAVIRIMGAGQLLFTHPESNQPFYESGVRFADPEIYQIFDIPLVEGSWESALVAPFQMVISEALARKYFGDRSALGETILLSNQAPVQITGVMAAFTENSHLEAEAFVSLSTTEVMFGNDYLVNWASNNFHTYLVTPPEYDIENLIDQIPDFLTRHVAENANDFTEFIVMPIQDIHLNSQRDNEFAANGNITTVYTFSAIAFFILLIACFNFMNLSTARSTSRAREVGLRKTLGADRNQIVMQFLGESVFLTLIALVIAAALVQTVLPWFNNLIGLDLSVGYFEGPGVFLAFLVLVLVVGLFAGSYPAFFLASFTPSSILKGELTQGTRGVVLRKVLVVMQFSISIALVVASGIALSQLRYAMNLDPGYTREQVLLYQGGGVEGLGSSYQTMKETLLRHPEIVSVTAANLMPGDQNTNADGVRYEGGAENFIGMSYLNVDFDFFETFDISFLSGRSFSSERPTDLFAEPDEESPNNSAVFIMNGIAANLIGYSPDTALNKWFEVGRRGGTVRGPIVGVVDDIYFSSIREAVKPVYYRVTEHDNPQGQFPHLRQMAIKVSGQNMPDTLAFIAATWSEFLPDVPMRQSYLDEKLNALYLSEGRQRDIFTAFSIMAFLIAGLGLFGLASYLTEQRTREIGIRKVLGSSVSGIVSLLTKDFTKLIIVANLIAWPSAWYFMNAWLENFAYRTTMGVGIFLFAGVLAWLIATVTVGLLAAMAANTNPTQSLRHE